MRTLSKPATTIFNKIIESIPEGKSHTKIDNCNKSFMPLSVEKINTYDMGTEYSLCHYFEQNGDLCQDPEMTFLRRENGSVCPMSFQMAIPPIYERSLFYDYNDGDWKINRKKQSEHTTFANKWLRNIKLQQNL